MTNKPRSRSRNGCFTCRRRKKKCDESSFPKCKNCRSNRLQCTWPSHVLALHKNNDRRENAEANSETYLTRSLSSYGPVPTQKESSPSTRLDRAWPASERPKNKSIYLERISMQQDCVELTSPGPMFLLPPETPSRNMTYFAGQSFSIRDRIAQQMDVLREDLEGSSSIETSNYHSQHE